MFNLLFIGRRGCWLLRANREGKREREREREATLYGDWEKNSLAYAKYGNSKVRHGRLIET